MAGRNLIVVITRGLRADVVAHESWPRLTPKLQSLAECGAQFVAGSACPVDDGGLVSLLTGLHARQHGFVEPARASRCRGWPAWLREAGHMTLGAGCVASVEADLDRCMRVEPVTSLDPSACAYAQAMSEKGLWPRLAEQRRARQRQGPIDLPEVELEGEDDIDGFIGARAAAMLAHIPPNGPWTLLVVFSGPGNQLPAPRPYSELAPLEELAEDFVPADMRSVDSVADFEQPRVLLQRLDTQALAQVRAHYLGRVALIDYGIGRLIRTARGRPDAQRTWLLVTSDHGMLLGDNGLLGHRSFLDGALEVPVVLAPLGDAKPIGVRQTQQGTGLVSTVDVAATVAALGGCDLPPECVGRSLAPGAQGQPVVTLANEVGCLSEFGRRLMLRTERHKIILDVDTRQTVAMYDLLNDPLETRNLTQTVLGKNLVDALRWSVADALLGLRVPAIPPP